MKTLSEPSFCVTVYVAGDVQTARESLRRQCFEAGLCVTLTATEFVYTAGAEGGVAVGFVNYPRFPATAEDVLSRAQEVARCLMDDLYQNSALVVAPDRTFWLTRRPEDVK
jgi:hypothetical protein